MKARILTATAFLISATAALPLRAADPQLLTLVMPEAKVLAGVNVEQAKGTPFGQYVLTQIQSNAQHMQELVALTGFDPTRDVRELLVASVVGTTPKTGLLLARGNFDAAKIAALAASKGAPAEPYGGLTILEDPKKTHGLAFVDDTLVVAGDLASVKSALDRRTVPSSLPTNVTVLVNQWSLNQDAWAITTVPPYTLHPPATAPQVPGVGPNSQAAFQAIQSAAAGVKFGNNVVLTAQAQADTAQNATAMADLLKFVINMAQMHAGQNEQALAFTKSLVISAQGTTVNITGSIPADQFQEIIKPKAGTRHQRPARHM
jgi:hypothetical protein